MAEPGAPESGVSRAAQNRTLLIAAAVVVLATLLATVVAIGPWSSSVTPGVPGDASVEAGFSRDMQEHHAQAVRMSTLVRDATDGPEVRQLALDILLTQQQQIGQLYGWLALWSLPQARAGAPMQWMGPSGGNSHQGMDMAGQADGVDAGKPGKPGEPAMPGMATAEQLERLGTLTGRTAERFYLQLMIPHHQGGVEMAESALRTATQPQVKVLAGSIVRAQNAELAVLREMLADRGGPLP